MLLSAVRYPPDFHCHNMVYLKDLKGEEA